MPQEQQEDLADGLFLLLLLLLLAIHSPPNALFSFAQRG
jgi:hypothetical protein